MAMLYTHQTDLRFDLENQSARDKQGNEYDTYAVERGDCVFFPLDVVCRHFGLDWSFTQTDKAPLIRITNAGAVLNTEDFTAAAATQMENYYTAYQRRLEEQNAAPRPPQTTPLPPVQTAEGQRVNLLFVSRDAGDTREVLTLLADAQVQAAFLLDTEQMEDGDRLRGIAAGGHSVVLAAAGNTEHAVEEEIRRGRELLWEAGCLWLDLVWYEGETDVSGLLEEMGCVRVRADLDQRGAGLGSASRARRLAAAVGRQGETVSVCLGDDGKSLGGLKTLLEELAASGCQMAAWRP